MRISRTYFAALSLALLSMFTTGFRACPTAEKKTVASNVISGLRVAARAVEPGVETVRAFREAGKITPAASLRLAQGALEANSAARRLAQAALDGADAASLYDHLDALVRLAGDLERDGTLHIKNEGTKLVFNLGVVAARNGLVLARDELRGGGRPEGFTLDGGTRRELEGLMPVFDRNDRLLREAVERLRGI